MKIKLIVAVICMPAFLSLSAQDAKAMLNTNVGTNISSPEEIKSNNLKVVANYFEYLFKTRNIVALEKIIAKDAIYTQAEGLPYGGTYIGFGEWANMYKKAQTFFDLKIEKEPTFYISSENNDVLITFTIKCRSKKSNKEIIMPIAEYFEVKEGLISAIRPFYFDTKTFTDFIK